MKTVARRTSGTMAEMLEWLEANTALNLSGVGLTPYVRIEDFQEEGAYVLRAELPGIDPEKDVEVTVENGVLTISGERREETREKNRQEFHYGSFRRTLTLPAGAQSEQVTAAYTDGVLEVRVPLSAEAPPTTRIPIQRHE